MGDPYGTKLSLHVHPPGISASPTVPWMCQQVLRWVAAVQAGLGAQHANRGGSESLFFPPGWGC